MTGLRCGFGSPKSKRSRRTIALDAGTVAVLREHRERQLPEQNIAGEHRRAERSRVR
jgi:hypothetical protein